jgi:hypothetical protein
MSHPETSTSAGEHGVALLVALVAMLLMSALGVALVWTTSSETLVAGNFGDAQEGLYAAEAVLERAVNDLSAVADWNTVLNGSARSAFVDGQPSGARSLPDGSTLDLGQVAGAATWRLYAYGPLSSMLPATIDSTYYVVALAADATPDAGGNGAPRLALRAEAFGPRGVRQIVEATVTRAAGAPGIRMLSWRHLRQGT